MWDETIKKVLELTHQAERQIREEIVLLCDDDYDGETETALAIADILEGVVRLCQNF